MKTQLTVRRKYENYGNKQLEYKTMKNPVILALLAVVACLYFRNSATPPAPTAQKPEAPKPAPTTEVAPHAITVAPASPYSRWKIGPMAQNDWKIGPNAQTDFEPFAPLEQADWNKSSGYTIVSGVHIRR